ncbi:ImmA/IrrE family metallo-endopeptidase [Catellatospora sp. NPDC049609]|uniref:ImmA/IrrE family metallo-endopeptidase n=1 Tax=Catellatospora sp. NPDC049609 TaxID=3155505 RepID=UPI00344044B2
MVEVLEKMLPGSRVQLAEDPFAVLEARGDLAVRIVPEAKTKPAAAMPACSVAGIYVDDEVPPVLAVANAASAGRRAFTVLHEFGHHLQRTEPALMDLLLEQADGGLTLEDAACDAFAAEILLPADLVDRFIDSPGPTGPQIVDLWHASTASRAAVCVRAAQRLVTPGHVVLLDADGAVSFAASLGLPPLARGSRQDTAATVRDALSRAGRATGRTRLHYRDGILGEELHAQVVPMDGYLLLIAVTDAAAWDTFTLPSRDPGPRAATRICEHPDCGHEFQAFESPCSRCARRVCPECGRCGCAPRVREKTCAGCFQRLPASVFTGTSARCNECV